MLARTETERARIAAPLCKSAAYIVDHGMTLFDPSTGRRTTWGYWDPADLNGVPGKMDERGGNSHEALGEAIFSRPRFPPHAVLDPLLGDSVFTLATRASFPCCSNVNMQQHPRRCVSF